MDATIICIFGTGKLSWNAMLSSSIVIAMRFVVISFLRATMFEKMRESMVSPSRKFSHVVSVWIQHAIQKSIGMGGWQKFFFFF